MHGHLIVIGHLHSEILGFGIAGEHIANVEGSIFLLLSIVQGDRGRFFCFSRRSLCRSRCSSALTFRNAFTRLCLLPAVWVFLRRDQVFGYSDRGLLIAVNLVIDQRSGKGDNTQGQQHSQNDNDCLCYTSFLLIHHRNSFHRIGPVRCRLLHAAAVKTYFFRIFIPRRQPMFFEWPNEAVCKWYCPVFSQPSPCNKNPILIHFYFTTHFWEMQHKKRNLTKVKKK